MLTRINTALSQTTKLDHFPEKNMQVGESSGSNSSSNEIRAKLVPSASNCSDIEIRSNEMIICSRTYSSLEKHVWCKITRNFDQSSAVLQNKSYDMILVDDSVVLSEEDAVISCGSEIVAGPNKDEHLPEDAANREDCWYGYSCRTQHHNEEHARKRNHVCRPTRGSHM